MFNLWPSRQYCISDHDFLRDGIILPIAAVINSIGLLYERLFNNGIDSNMALDEVDINLSVLDYLKRHIKFFLRNSKDIPKKDRKDLETFIQIIRRGYTRTPTERELFNKTLISLLGI